MPGDRQCEAESAALAFGALDRDLASHRLDELAHYCQSEAGARSNAGVSMA